MEIFKKIAKLFKNKNSELYQISVYELIDKARNFFITNDYKGMCIAFEMALFLDYCIFDDETKTKIIENIEKFNSEWLVGKKIPKDEFWWELDDIQSRINAFDKLLEYYKHHPKTIYINQ